MTMFHRKDAELNILREYVKKQDNKNKVIRDAVAKIIQDDVLVQENTTMFFKIKTYFPMFEHDLTEVINDINQLGPETDFNSIALSVTICYIICICYKIYTRDLL